MFLRPEMALARPEIRPAGVGVTTHRAKSKHANGGAAASCRPSLSIHQSPLSTHSENQTGLSEILRR